MSRADIVCILGAGASKPYGLPLGSELVDAIKENLGRQRQRFENWGFKETLIDDFRRELEISQVFSVDDYLQNHPEFRSIGKHAIAQVLLSSENESRLLNRDTPEHWYLKLFNHLKTLAPPDIARYGVITFNYDRSLEHYLFTTARSYFGQKGLEMVQAIAQVTVIHVHGLLGDLNPMGLTVPYQPQEESSTIVRAASRIKTIGEDLEDRDVGRAQVLIQQARKIRFFGFGFHESNLKTLEFAVNAQTRDVYGSTYGLNDSALRSLMVRYPTLKSLDRKHRKLDGLLTDEPHLLTI